MTLNYIRNQVLFGGAFCGTLTAYINRNSFNDGDTQMCIVTNTIYGGTVGAVAAIAYPYSAIIFLPFGYGLYRYYKPAK